MQILHRFAGTIQRYSEELSDPGRYRPDHCPQCEADRPLRAHGFYTRTLVDIAFDGTIRVRRLRKVNKLVMTALTKFALPYQRLAWRRRANIIISPDCWHRGPRGVAPSGCMHEPLRQRIDLGHKTRRPPGCFCWALLFEVLTA